MYYRDFVAKRYNIGRLSSYYDIHHIDMNRENNNLDNLLIMPKWLHKRYHSYNVMARKILQEDYEYKICDTASIYPRLISPRESVRSIMEVLYECGKWYDYKMYLDGKMENIHNFNLQRKDFKQ
jgi:hypothetical protein